MAFIVHAPSIVNEKIVNRKDEFCLLGGTCNAQNTRIVQAGKAMSSIESKNIPAAALVQPSATAGMKEAQRRSANARFRPLKSYCSCS
jgi:hypothetical protein